MKGESITHGCTRHRWVNPVQRVLNWVIYLLQHKTPFSTPLCSYFDNNIWTEITAMDITKAMRTTLVAHGSQFGLTQSDISARSIRVLEYD